LDPAALRTDSAALEAQFERMLRPCDKWWLIGLGAVMERDELIELRLSTEPFAKSGQIDAFLEVWSRHILRMEMDSVDGQPLELDMRIRSLPDFAMAAGALSPMRNRHTTGLIDNDDLVLVVVEKGTAEVSQYGRAATIGDGDAALTANGAPASLLGLKPCRVINYRFSRKLLLPQLPQVDDLVARPIAKDNPALRLLVGYAGVLNDQRELATAELRRAVSTHMHDLAALLLGGKAEPQLAEGLRAARLQAVKEDILQRIAQSSLSVSEIARSQQISERYLSKLFATDGTTFTDFVREARLARAHRMLIDPAQDHRPIYAIAYENGFGDLSYFNRTFRQRYNMTPSEARELARRDNGAGS
jgi:AraC-like DNA-binding protein